jgi:hypothetical protein
VKVGAGVVENKEQIIEVFNSININIQLLPGILKVTSMPCLKLQD